ncbi:MAG: right-handed parallel beta-helix repeat-containing protein [Armatimonadota bacterium]
MKPLLLALTLLVCCSLTLAAPETAMRKLTLYVSPSGNDAWSGKLATANAGHSDGPVATLTRARDLVREAKKAPGGLPGAVTVELQAGVYELSSTFALTAEDSGTASRPITYRAAKGAEVRIVGGRVLSGFGPVKDAAVLARLDPAARGKVLVTDLKAQGVKDYPPMVNASTWGSSEPGLEVFFADEPMTLSRWPNMGYTRITGVKGATPVDVRGTKGTAEGVFTYEGDRASRWVGEPDLMTNGFWMWDWADQRYRVKNLDLATKTITVDDEKNRHAFGFRTGQWFYIYNALSELDAPGEWYLDRQNGLLYFWPPKAITSGKTIVSLLRDLVALNDVSNVKVQGLTFEACQGSAVNITGGESCQVAACTIRNLGGNGVNVNGGQRHEVFGCDLYNLGNGGVNLSGGDRKTLTPAGHNVEDCHIYKFGRWNPVYKAGIRLDGVGNRAAHNLLNDAPHMAIGFSGNDQVIEFNEIHSVVHESNDAGVIYTGYNWTMRGNLIRYNYFHDIYGFEGRGCVGVYLDDQFSSATMFGNVFYKVPNATFSGGGRDNVFENNIFVDCNPSVHIDARGLGWQKDGVQRLIDGLKEVPYREEPWRSRYPEMLTLPDQKPGTPFNNLVARNICVGGRWSDIEPIGREGVKFVDNFTEGDPLFVNAKKLDFRLKPESPAFKLGFKPIPIEKIGLYQDRLRASWPVVAPVKTPPVRPAEVAAPDRVLPPMTVSKVAQAPAVDGTLAPGEWPATTFTLQEDPGRTKIKGKPAVARVAHDGQTLYVAVTIPLDKPSALKRTEVWGQDDGMEVCLRSAAAKETPAFVLHGFPTGKFLSVEDAGVSTAAADKLGKATHFAAKVEGNAWTGEWAISLAGAGLAYQPGLKLAFNIGVRRCESDEWIIWQGALGPTWRVDNAGVLVLQ